MLGSAPSCLVDVRNEARGEMPRLWGELRQSDMACESQRTAEAANSVTHKNTGR
jgi:hypothetical protein